MYVLHPWHGAHYGEDAPQIVNALIEIPQGSKSKYEIDKKTGLLKLDRVIYSSFHYPVNYGFIPQTLGQDGDPLDILVMCSESIQPLCLVESYVIGNMQMIDTGLIDDKIIITCKLIQFNLKFILEKFVCKIRLIQLLFQKLFFSAGNH